MITLKVIAGLESGSIVWDEGRGSVTGLGARRQKGEAVAYVLKYRTNGGRQRWLTIGRHGAPWTPEMARTEARRILVSVSQGGDPATNKRDIRLAPTVADLCAEYMVKAEAGKLLSRGKPKKASTLATDVGRINRHIVPLLGHLKVAAVVRKDIENFRDYVTDGKTAIRVKTEKRGGVARVRGGKGTATRTMGLLGAIFAYAVKHDLRPDNPCRGVERHADDKRTRRLTDEEYLKLGKSLCSVQDVIWPMAVEATKFLLLTGWRRGEMLKLRWSQVDFANRTATLHDTKTGISVRPFARRVLDLLQALPRYGELVFPSSRDFQKPMTGYHKTWLRIAEMSGMPRDVTPHVFRHSFASVAVDLGYSELTIASLIGHKKGSITSRYTHHADAVLLAAADVVVDKIAGLLGEAKPEATVIQLKQA